MFGQCRRLCWKIKLHTGNSCRSHWPRGLRRRSTAARQLRLWVRIPRGAWMFVCCECCVLSDRGLCDGLITRPEESYWLWRVVVCDQETSRRRRRIKPAMGLWKIQPQGCNAKKTKNNKQQAIHSQCRFCKLIIYLFKTFVSLLSGHASYFLFVQFTNRVHRGLI